MPQPKSCADHRQSFACSNPIECPDGRTASFVQSCRLGDRCRGAHPHATAANGRQPVEPAHRSPQLGGGQNRPATRHPNGSLAWLSWIIARLGGWNCYYKPHRRPSRRMEPLRRNRRRIRTGQSNERDVNPLALAGEGWVRVAPTQNTIPHRHAHGYPLKVPSIAYPSPLTSRTVRPDRTNALHHAPHTQPGHRSSGSSGPERAFRSAQFQMDLDPQTATFQKPRTEPNGTGKASHASVPNGVDFNTAIIARDLSST